MKRFLGFFIHQMPLSSALQGCNCNIAVMSRVAQNLSQLLTDGTMGGYVRKLIRIFTRCRRFPSPTADPSRGTPANTLYRAHLTPKTV